MLARLQAAAGAAHSVGDVRGRGAMVAVELVGADGRTPDKDAAARVAGACHGAGLLVLTAGTYGNVVRLLPPLVMPDDLLDEGLGILTEALAQA